MKIDHIIIFTEDKGREAEELLEYGLIEGSSRFHPGQGTANRKFYFENFFLELLYVIDKREVKNELTTPIRLWERANYGETGCAPFGLCLANTRDIDIYFRNSINYKPAYLPEGYSFDIITNEDHPYLPWTCRLPFTSQQYLQNEPLEHPAGIRKLTKVIFGIPGNIDHEKINELYNSLSELKFKPAEHFHLTLEFDFKNQGKLKNFRKLPLSIAH
jgi:hypothetical protein